MITYTYEFTVTLRGKGSDEESAWQDAVEAFAEDPGAPVTAKVVDGDVPERDDVEG